MPESAPLGVWFDFNFGARIHLPPYSGNTVRKLRLYDYIDEPSEFVFPPEGMYVTSSRCFYIKYRIELFEDDKLVFEYDYDCKNKNVLILIEGVLGDTIAWLPYVEKFIEKHGCNATVGIDKNYLPLFRNTYQNLNMVDKSLLNDKMIKSKSIFATYVLAYEQKADQRRFIPVDRRGIRLNQVAPYILGLDITEVIKPRINLMSPNKRPIKEKYVVIGAQATAGFKMWNNPDGWSAVVNHLRKKDYRVVCVDKACVFGPGLPHEHYPEGLEDETGNRPLPERARWLAHADLFIGLGSGLSWLSWAVGTPVVMISGFSNPISEFENPYRVINLDVCNSCWNDSIFETFDRYDWFWCPRHRGTPRQHECSKKISVDQVITMIDKALADRECHVRTHDAIGGVQTIPLSMGV